MSLVTCPPYISASAVAVANAYGFDPYADYNVLGMHFDGANNSTAFVDSVAGRAISLSGSPILSTSTLKYGSASLYSPTQSDFAIVPASADFEFTGDFTVECFVNFPTLPASYVDFLGNYTANNAQNWNMEAGSNGVIGIYMSGGTETNHVYTATNAIVADTWYHVAWVRSGTTSSFYLDGVFVGSRTLAGTLGENKAITIGARGFGSGPSRVDDVRITKGVARYTAAFTPPAQTFPDAFSYAEVDPYWDNVELLLRGNGAASPSNSTVVESSSGRTITKVGATALGAFSPFGNIGGSYYFGPARTDYLTGPASASALWPGAGDFTFETWVYQTASPGLAALFSYGTSGAVLRCFVSGNSLSIWSGTTQMATATLGGAYEQWNHIAIVRNSGTIYGYINGKQVFTVANTTNYASGTMGIGAEPAGGNAVVGYMSNVRLVVGTAVYTAEFVPPTTTLSAITNTVLLLLFEGAGIVDTAVKTNVQLIGAAGQSTTVKRFGTAALSFTNGTSALQLPNRPEYQLGAANFTIEGWMNFITLSGPAGIISMRAGSGGDGFLFYFTSTTLTFYSSNSVVLSASYTLPLNTWVHVALTRLGNVFTFWVNGVSVGTATAAITINPSTSPLVFGRNSANNLDYFNGYLDEFRITKGVARYATAFVPVKAPFPSTKLDGTSTFDPFALSVASQIHFEGSHLGTTFTDQKGNTITPTGATMYTSTTRARQGSSSAFFNGGYLLVTQPAATFTAAEWTVESWVWLDSTKIANTFFHTFPYFTLGISMNRTGLGDTHVYIGNGSSWVGAPAITSASTGFHMPLNCWAHVALVKVGGVLNLYHNGKLAGSTASLPTGFTGNFRLGSLTDGTELFKGYIDEFRISTFARYLNGFNPSKLVLPLLTNSEYATRYTDTDAASVSLQIGFDNHAVSDATGKRVLTNTAVVPSTQVFTENASGYFNGAACISAAAHADFAFGTGDFTLEAWVSPIGSGVGTLFDTRSVSSSTLGVAVGILSTRTIRVYSGDSQVVTSSLALAAGIWSHVAVVRISGVVKIYINGILDGSTAFATNLTNTNMMIGRVNGSAASFFTGFMDNVRVTKGVARYTAAFTPTAK